MKQLTKIETVLISGGIATELFDTTRALEFTTNIDNMVQNVFGRSNPNFTAGMGNIAHAGSNPLQIRTLIGMNQLTNSTYSFFRP